MEDLDRQVLAAIAGEVLKPELVDEIVAAAREMFAAEQQQDHLQLLQRDLEAVKLEQERLPDAIVAGVDLPAIVDRLQAAERRRR